VLKVVCNGLDIGGGGLDEVDNWNIGNGVSSRVDVPAGESVSDAF
jgi:hypothetical protein